MKPKTKRKNKSIAKALRRQQALHEIKYAMLVCSFTGVVGCIKAAKIKNSNYPVTSIIEVVKDEIIAPMQEVDRLKNILPDSCKPVIKLNGYIGNEFDINELKNKIKDYINSSQ